MKDEDKRIVALAKFGKYRHMKRFINSGEMRFGTMQEFVDAEKKDPERGDKYETTFSIDNIHDCIISFRGLNEPESAYRPILRGKVHLKEFYNENAGNVYCIFSIREPEDDETATIDMNNSFGNYCVVITDVSRFIRNVEAALSSKQLTFLRDPVKYSSFTEQRGRWVRTPFMKDLRFAHQKEYRFWVQTKFTSPLFISIGSMKEYAHFFHINQIPNVKIKMIGADEVNL